MDTADQAALTGAALAGPDGVAVQPIVARDGQVVAHEALSRWLVAAPDVVLAAAARAGRLVEAEVAALRACLAALDAVDGPVSVNVSAVTLADGRATDLLRPHAPRLWVEVIETARLADHPDALPQLQQLRDVGATVAVDDAGAAHAGLEQIELARPDVLKLDRHLCAAALRGAAGARWTVALLLNAAAAHTAQVVAEGVAGFDDGLLSDVRLFQSHELGMPRLL